MPIVTVGIDLAKNVFAVYGVDEAGKVVLIKPRVSRDKLRALIAQLPPCVIGMEACSGAHYWARVPEVWPHSEVDGAKASCPISDVRQARQE